MNNLRNQESAFSLVELLISVTVLGLVSFTLMKFYGNQRVNSQELTLNLARDRIVDTLRSRAGTLTDFKSIHDRNPALVPCTDRERTTRCFPTQDEVGLILTDFAGRRILAGTPDSPQYYDTNGSFCRSSHKESCAFRAVATFRALCPGNAASCDEAESVIINWLVTPSALSAKVGALGPRTGEAPYGNSIRLRIAAPPPEKRTHLEQNQLTAATLADVSASVPYDVKALAGPAPTLNCQGSQFMRGINQGAVPQCAFVTSPSTNPVFPEDNGISQGLVGSVYDLLKSLNPGESPHSKFSKIPDLSKIQPEPIKLLKNTFDIPQRAFTEGFPKVPDLYSWFALQFRGRLNITVEGDYTFIINSDDGANVYLSGIKIIDNDGVHDPRTVRSEKINLKAGQYPFSFDYYQGPPLYIALQLYWIRPGTTTPEIIPSYAFLRPLD